MKLYVAIGHWKENKNITSIVHEQNTKADLMRDCSGNGFVPYVVLTEKCSQRYLTRITGMRYLNKSGS